MYMYIYIYIQLPCGPIPATVPGMGPKATKTIQNRHQKLSKNHKKLMPGGVPEALGGGLGTILAPRGARRRKRVKNRTWRPPPQGPSCEAKFGLFVDFVSLFSNCFLSVVFEGFRVRFYVDLGRFFKGFLNIFLLNFDVKRKL